MSLGVVYKVHFKCLVRMHTCLAADILNASCIKEVALFFSVKRDWRDDLSAIVKNRNALFGSLHQAPGNLHYLAPLHSWDPKSFLNEAATARLFFHFWLKST